MLIMWAIGKCKPLDTDFVLEDVGAVDLTPWKYAKPASVVCFICMLGVLSAWARIYDLSSALRLRYAAS